MKGLEYNNAFRYNVKMVNNLVFSPVLAPQSTIYFEENGK